eukprot:2365739-Rhodomonas_salina.1
MATGTSVVQYGETGTAVRVLLQQDYFHRSSTATAPAVVPRVAPSTDLLGCMELDREGTLQRLSDDNNKSEGSGSDANAVSAA